MSASPKAQLLDDSRVTALAGNARPALEIAARPAKLDFAANPNHYRVSQKDRESKPKRARGTIGHLGCCWSATPANCWIRTSANKVKENDSAVPIMEGHDFSRAN
jgi:hypothetical protein